MTGQIDCMEAVAESRELHAPPVAGFVFHGQGFDYDMSLVLHLGSTLTQMCVGKEIVQHCR